MARRGFGFGSVVRNRAALGGITRNFTLLKSTSSMGYTMPSKVLSGDFTLSFNVYHNQVGGVIKGLLGGPLGAGGGFVAVNNPGTFKINIGVNADFNAFPIAANVESAVTVSRVGTQCTLTTPAGSETLTVGLGDFEITTVGQLGAGFYYDGIISDINISNGERFYAIDETWIGPSTVMVDSGTDGLDGVSLNIDEDDSETFTDAGGYWNGEDITINGAFDTDTDWTKGVGWTISGGTADFTGAGGSSEISQTGYTVIDNASYRTTLDVVSNTGASANTIEIFGTQVSDRHLDAGSYAFVGVETSGSVWSFLGKGGEPCAIDNISLKRILLKSSVYTIHTLGDSFATEIFTETLNENLDLSASISLDGVGATSLVQQATRFDSTPQYYDDILVIMDGGLDDGSANAIIAIDDMVANLTHDNWIWVQPTPSNFIEGSANRINWDAKVAAISAHVGVGHYVECLTALQAANDGSAGDLQDLADNIVPRSLRGDFIHENDKGTGVRTRVVADFIRSSF